jgi:hypothetical protein
MPHDRAHPPPSLPRGRRDDGRRAPRHRRLAGIFGLRMLGMFIILPVFALVCETLPAAAITRSSASRSAPTASRRRCCRFPFGWASDRWGRKPVIVAGLLIFALGSFVAAWAPTIGWTIAGRDHPGRRRHLRRRASRWPPISRATRCARARWPRSG